ncbi:MAG: family 65 glycosyl hydrolase [Treponema sp.]|jgi:maltose phosphorylase|nr:family 65 glycosyl hydrolase [Treponema sp.]
MTKTADQYFLCDPWKIIEEGWDGGRNLVSESVFSLGNEYMGCRGYAEEGGEAETLRGSYFNGIYEEADLEKSYKGIVTKTHFMVNAVDWLHSEIRAVFEGGGETETLDVSKCEISGFRRVLDMESGTLNRSFDWHTKKGPVIHIEFARFLDMENARIAYQKICFSTRGGGARINVFIANDFNTVHGWNKKNYWNVLRKDFFENGAAVHSETIRTGQQIFSGFIYETSEGAIRARKETEKSAGFEISFPLDDGGSCWVEKRIYNYAVKERGGAREPVWESGLTELKKGLPSFDGALLRQRAYWKGFWKNADIRIGGDPLNQQGIRYCVFQMNQTYHGFDPSNNIGAKGLTGEFYNGHTFWDTETYCLPFYLFSNPAAARNLLMYRYATLAQAKERALQLDCRGACYPLATLNGEEACSLWQHASLQFQPSSAAAYGIFHYVNVTGDVEFLYDYGAEMLLEISRFFASRGAWNAEGTGFGFYGVMGPDEFHMMVNHNAYTNFMAKKTFEYAIKTLNEMEKSKPEKYAALCKKTGFNDSERAIFKLCAEKMIILYDEETKLFEQHERYFALPHTEISQIPITDFPLYHNWSYDRIYRTDMIKQPDALMFLFLHSSAFTEEVKRANYEFYEPRTIHESSLSPSIHSIFACELGKQEDAFRFFAFATRMDLDNYNRNTGEGLHTTSIAAAWMNIVYGFGGMQSDGETLSLNPALPRQWAEYEFAILYRGIHIRVRVSGDWVTLSTEDPVSEAIPLEIYGKPYLFNSRELKILLRRTNVQAG